MLAAVHELHRRAAAVVVDVPDRDGRGAGVFAGELSGVEQFLGPDSLVALYFPVRRGVYGLVL